MADDTVQQIVPGTSSSAVNVHPSLVQRRSPGRRRRRDHGKDQQDDNPAGHREKGSAKRGDTVTLSTMKKSGSVSDHARNSGSVSKEASPSSHPKIDIRI